MKNLLLLAAALATTPALRAQTPSYPKAEWNTAKVILMHTPGEELFDGVIHPTAGLFEHYFDVESAAREHQGYISKLERNGIKVYRVTDILQHLETDTLRNLASQTLIYDISQVNAADTA